jgi:NADH-quinone oxidoreductase subunit C
MLTFEALSAVVRKHVTGGEVIGDLAATPKALKIPASDIVRVCHALQHDPSTYFDSLSCVTGIDNGPEANTMEVVYNLYSIPFHHHLMIKVLLPRERPAIDSVSGVWKTAEWHEREIFDMFGIEVKNHPDLRRILMPADWEGYPLRKDYKHQEYYRNIKVEY